AASTASASTSTAACAIRPSARRPKPGGSACTGATTSGRTLAARDEPPALPGFGGLHCQRGAFKEEDEDIGRMHGPDRVGGAAGLSTAGLRFGPPSAAGAGTDGLAGVAAGGHGAAKLDRCPPLCHRPAAAGHRQEIAGSKNGKSVKA